MLDTPTVYALEPISALWPSIIVAIVLTIYRLLINRIFESWAIYYANQQILKEKPKFLAKMLNCYESVNKVTSRSRNGDSMTHRNIASEPANTQELEIEFDSVCKKNKAIDHVYNFFNDRDIALTKPQRRAIKSYHKAVSDFVIKKDKYLESVFKVTVVSSIAMYGFYVVNIKHDFFMNHRSIWPKYPDQEPYRQETDNWLLYYYILSIGYHTQRTLFQFHNPGRKDFVALVIHHWSTIILLIFSYLASFLRTGSLVLFIHENSDIFLESAKLCGYTSFSFGSEFFFVLFVLSWVIMRLWAFNYKILYEIIRFGYLTLFIGNSPLFYNWVCVSLLFVLYGLHIYWTKLIIAMLIKKCKGHKLKDIRSDTEDEGKEINVASKSKQQ
mmetsp:Transcript_56715/g.51035  ORF Transcript_56715/g.51035 Transcript_56715/m.51035 type:complete len:385 (+) Transcript_56715:19-1173(+)